MISNKRSLDMGDNIGMQIMVKQLKLLDEDFTMLLNKPSFYTKKPHMQIIKEVNPTTILSIVMGKIIPFAVKYKDLDEQPITKLMVSTGEAILQQVRLELYLRDLKNKEISPKVKLQEYIKISNLDIKKKSKY